MSSFSLSKLFCALGFHKWEKDPSEKTNPRYEEVPLLAFISYTSQNGIKNCERNGCQEQLFVKRGGIRTKEQNKIDDFKWQKMNEREKQCYIDNTTSKTPSLTQPS